MTQLEKPHKTDKAHTTSGVGLLSRLLVVFFLATVCLLPTVNVLAQQPVQTGGQAQSAVQGARGQNHHDPKGDQHEST